MNFKIRHTEKDYVCPICFNRIKNCTCEFDSFNLIMIDRKIQTIIKKLNQKHYFTQACCEGHYKGQNKIVSGYISFKTNKPEGCPQGWKVSRNEILYICKPKNKSDFFIMQKEALLNLRKWVNSL